MKFLKNIMAVTALAGLMASVVTGVSQASTLADVKAKGFIQCGVNTGRPGFSVPDDAGNWTGFDVDSCRAVSAAVFGDADKVKYTPLTAKERFTALSSGEIDILSRTTTWTYHRDVALGLDFTTVNFYDGQGFMVPKSLGVKSALELDGATVCIQQGTTTELNLADYFRANGMKYTPVAFEKNDEVVAAYDSGRCDIFTGDRGAGLATLRLKLSSPDDHVVLPEIISKEPLGPVVRHGDNQWKDIVIWSLFAQINAEELGITSANVDELIANSTDPGIRRFLGVEGGLGSELGLPDDWAAQIIKQVGNYGESFESHLGLDTPLQLTRGVNALWTEGGILYAPPVR